MQEEEQKELKEATEGEKRKYGRTRRKGQRGRREMGSEEGGKGK